MKIATNSPFSFSLPSGYEFFHLGDGIDDVDAIVLLLEKNWGGGSIDQINALTYWVSLYPKSVPCLLVGCESTIPDKNIQKYLMKTREDAIRALCDEVLSRSNSIGVRGEITYLYLKDVLNYTKDQIDIIYDADFSDNIQRIRDFIEKNNQRLAIFERIFLNFQAGPQVFYSRPKNFQRSIIVHTPYVSQADHAARVSADIQIDASITTLWCETDKIYQEFLLSERGDAFVCALLPFAMRSGKNIVCEAPLTEHFLHNINEILVPQLCAHDPRLYRTQVIAQSDATPLIYGNAVSTGFSCGVDSFYTVHLYRNAKQNSMKITHLYTGNYLYGNDSKIYQRAEMAAAALGLPLVCTRTNLSEALKLPHVYTHFFKTMFGVLCLRKLFRTYYYSTAEDFSHFSIKGNATADTAIFELLLLYVFSCPDFQVLTGGVKAERLEKTAALASFPEANKFLNVCLHPELEQNCGKCAKCMRTLLMLDMHGIIENFAEVFDLSAYSSDRINSFIYLVKQKNSIMLSDVYRYFLKHEPDLMRQAEARLRESEG